MIRIEKPTEELFCERCNAFQNYEVKEQEETYQVRGERIQMKSKVAYCKKCGAELFEPYLENENLKNAYLKYSQLHNLVTPQEIVAIRGKYQLSQAEFAELLGVGRATIERYERGSLPTKSLSELVKSANDPQDVLEILERNANKIDRNLYKKVKMKARQFISRSSDSFPFNDIFNSIFQNINVVKALNVINAVISSYIRVKAGHNYITKVRLAKLLWFVDSEYHRRYSISLSTLVYAHLPYGPAPDDFDLFLSMMEKKKMIRLEKRVAGEKEETRIYLDSNSDTSELPNNEFSFIFEIVKQYASLSPKRRLRSAMSSSNGEIQ